MTTLFSHTWHLQTEISLQWWWYEAGVMISTVSVQSYANVNSRPSAGCVKMTCSCSFYCRFRIKIKYMKYKTCTTFDVWCINMLHSANKQKYIHFSLIFRKTWTIKEPGLLYLVPKMTSRPTRVSRVFIWNFDDGKIEGKCSSFSFSFFQWVSGHVHTYAFFCAFWPFVYT